MGRDLLKWSKQVKPELEVSFGGNSGLTFTREHTSHVKPYWKWETIYD